MTGRRSFVTRSAAALRPRLSRGCMAKVTHSYTFRPCKHGWQGSRKMPFRTSRNTKCGSLGPCGPCSGRVPRSERLQVLNEIRLLVPREVETKQPVVVLHHCTQV